MAHSPPLVDESGAISRLRKLCAAKDAQIEGLTSRVEVLSDDLHDLIRERDHLLSTCSQLEECAHQCQEEASGAEERVASLEADLKTATHRAEAAEAAEAQAEADFGTELRRLKAEALHDVVTAMAAAHAPAAASAAACHSRVAAQPSPAPPGSSACMEALAEAQATDGLTRQNAALQAEVEALRAEADGMRDQLIERTESELALTSFPPQGRTPHGPPRPGCGGGGGGGSGGTPADGSRSPWEDDAEAVLATQDTRARWHQELQPPARQPACRTPCAALPAQAEGRRRASGPGNAPSRAGAYERGGAVAQSAALPPSKPLAPLSASQSGAHRPAQRPLAPAAFPAQAQAQAARTAGGARAAPPAEPTGRRRPPDAHEEIRALLAANQSVLLAVANL